MCRRLRGNRMNPIPEWATPMVGQVPARSGDRFVDRIGRDAATRNDASSREVPGRGTLPAIRAAARRDPGIPEIAPGEAPQSAGRASRTRSGTSPGATLSP
jgi:hypothetical protein